MPPAQPRINRCSVLVFPRWTYTTRGGQKTQMYDAKWRRLANKVAQEKDHLAVIVGDYKGRLSPAEKKQLLEARKKIGKRLVVVKDIDVSSLSAVLKRRGIPLAENVSFTGLGQHYTNEKGIGKCIAYQTREVADVIQLKDNRKFVVDKKSSIRETENVIFEEFLKANRTREVRGKHKKKWFFARSLHTFVNLGVLSYGSIAKACGRDLPVFREMIDESLVRRVSNPFVRTKILQAQDMDLLRRTASSLRLPKTIAVLKETRQVKK